mmetsp:Transcript_13215/g.19909  ORF Transcript_13215/g.19909 Transcript_13215/m.19909 type:complete len:202 (+) Transcript_13215:22-627(+)
MTESQYRTKPTLEPLQPVPGNVLFPPRATSESVSCCCNSNTKRITYETDANGIMQYKIRPNNMDTFLMLPPCLFVGCCLSVSANVIFDDNNHTVRISNWMGYMCIPPCYSYTTISYYDIANIGLLYTGIKEGTEPNEVPIYDVVLVTHKRKMWRVGNRSSYNSAASEASNLLRFVFGRSNPDYVLRVETFKTNSCCSCCAY